MFALAATRRHLFAGAGLVAAVGMTGMLPRALMLRRPQARSNIQCRRIPRKSPAV